MPRLLRRPFYIELIGFHGKQASLENCKSTCFWGANQTIETHCKLISMFFPAKLGSDSPIEHMDQMTFQICTGEYDSELKILGLYSKLTRCARNTKKEGIVFAVCAKDIENTPSKNTESLNQIEMRNSDSLGHNARQRHMCPSISGFHWFQGMILTQV